jgi:hypothetical protein
VCGKSCLHLLFTITTWLTTHRRCDVLSMNVMANGNENRTTVWGLHSAVPASMAFAWPRFPKVAMNVPNDYENTHDSLNYEGHTKCPDTLHHACVKSQPQPLFILHNQCQAQSASQLGATEALPCLALLLTKPQYASLIKAHHLSSLI